MILLTRLSGTVFALNSDLVERVDSTPDTVITLIGGTKYVVGETVLEVVAAVREHRAEVLALSDAWDAAGERVRAPDGRRRPSLAVVSTYPGDVTGGHSAPSGSMPGSRPPGEIS